MSPSPLETSRRTSSVAQTPPPKKLKPDIARSTSSLSAKNASIESIAGSQRKRSRKGRTARARIANMKRKLNDDTVPIESAIIKDKEYLDFLDWLKQMGCPKTKLTLAEFSNTGRGMMATKDIKAGEVIVQVPESNLVTMKSLEAIYGSRIVRAKKKINSHMIIALHIALMMQDPERLGWLPYLRLLPKKFDTMPIRYPKELFDLLPPHAQAHVNRQRSKIMADYNSTLEFLKVNNDLLKRPLEYEDYEWAWLVVNTRCIYLDAKKQDTADNIALAPMLDFLNHTHDAKTEGFFCTKTKSYKIKTLLPYKKGEQVFINYGPHDNCFILVEYGFVTPNNPFNYALVDNHFLQLSIPGESPSAKKDKMDLLTMSGYFCDYALHRNDVSFRLMVAMRLRLINPFSTASVATQLEIAKWHNVVGGELDQISSENERLLPKYIEILCDALLSDAKKSLSILARKPTTFPVVHLQQLWIETRDIALSVIDKIHRNEQL